MGEGGVISPIGKKMEREYFLRDKTNKNKKSVKREDGRDWDLV